MHRFAILLVVPLAVAGCGLESDTTPVGAARAFIQSAQRGNCKKAWGLLSADGQRNLENERAKLAARKINVTLEQMYCADSNYNTFASMIPSSANLGDLQEGWASVVFELKGDNGKMKLHLSKEGKKWRVIGTGM